MTPVVRTPALIIALSTLCAAAAPPQTPSSVVEAAEREGSLLLYATTDPVVAQPLLDDFASLHPKVRVEFRHFYSSQLHEQFLEEVTEGAHTADLLWSSAMDLQMKLANDGYALAYRSAETDQLPEWAVWKGEAYGTTFEPIVFVYSRKGLAATEVPHSRRELAQLIRSDPERFRGKLATYDPEHSGIGCLILTNDARTDPSFDATIRAYGAARPKLYASSVHVLDAVSSGEQLLGVNVLGSYALARKREDPSLEIVYPRDYTLAMSRIALIPKAARHPNAAKLFLDYLLSARGQQLAANVSGLGSVRNDVTGPLTAATLSKELGRKLRPVRLGPSLLVYLDQSSRAAFLRRWRAALEGK